MHPAARVLLEQGGVARQRDLRAAGLSRRRLQRAVADGALRQLAPHVLGLPVAAEHEELKTAVAAVGGLASHQDAARLWDLELVAPGQARHVSVPRSRSRRAHPGVVVHRADIRPDDVQERHGIPVTSVVRTLFDLCRSLPVAEALATVDSALRRGLVTVEELVGALAALPRGRGRPRVSLVLGLADPACGSVLESLCRVLLVQAGLAPAETQLQIRGAGRVDFAWPGARLVVETDGFAFHADRASYRQDRRRGNALVLAGWRVLRFSWEDVMDHPDLVVAQVREALAAH